VTRAVVWRIENETGWAAYSREQDALKMHALEGGTLTPLVPETNLLAARHAVAQLRDLLLRVQHGLTTGDVHDMPSYEEVSRVLRETAEHDGSLDNVPPAPARVPKTGGAPCRKNRK
jgi:hypothetical protein